MLKIDIFNLFSRDEKIIFSRFVDPLGNFEIFHHKTWKYDEDIAVVDGKYLISFESKDARFVVSVDASLASDFNFDAYAKEEIDSPTSGIHASVKKRSFRNMPAYEREYLYESAGKNYFGGGLIFFTGTLVISLSWTAPEKQKEKYESIFRHMIEKLHVR
ncbi:hypothetical protein KKB44_06535 [Candidatus Micrarchaeota archaeon]|nr:hypothetical protein [Candidatus Micrarchaeota archaeon]